MKMNLRFDSGTIYLGNGLFYEMQRVWFLMKGTNTAMSLFKILKFFGTILEL